MNLRIIALKLLGLFCLIIAPLVNTDAKTFSKQNKLSDNVIYAQAFFQVVGFDKESNKISNEPNRLFYKNYFKREARLSEEQYEILKAIAYDFTDVIRLLPGNKKLNLVSLYRSRLKNSLGENAFNDFNSFVKEKIAPNTTIIKSGNMLTLGTSSISLNTGNHKLLGSSTTNAFQLSPLGGITCSVSATMTGPGVSLSGSNSECVTTNPSVTFMSSDYQPNVQYCVNGIHTINGESGSSSDCTTTPNTPRVTSVTYERILTDDLNFDTNPNTGGGLRMYPDKKVPGENETTTNRRKIRIRAKYFQATANVRIYFRNFDPDDPSSNAAPVDDTTNAGDDNRGDVDGTAATKKGQFSYPQPPNPNPFDCQPFTNGVSCLTDANGEATVDFIVTKQPGDNFTVAASPDSDYLSNLTLAADGINLKDGNNLNTPVTKITTPASNACATTALAACRAEMLTVWRRLHVEVDSMGLVAGNKAIGTITNATQGMFDIELTVNTSPEDHRFEPGIIVINNVGTFNVLENAGNLVKIDSNASPSTLIGKSFELFDDDDFDNNNNPNIGDIDEDVVETAPTFSKMQQSDKSSENLYAPAYIMPIYDGGGSMTNNTSGIQFQLNIAPNQNQSQINLGRNSGPNESDYYWVIYIQIGYQGDTSVDRDPDVDTSIKDPGTDLARTPVFGSADTVPNDCSGVPRGGDGSVIYQESIRDLFYVNYRDKDDGATVPHEVGHQFGIDGDKTGQGLMSSDPKEGQTFIGSHLHLLRCRKKSPGEI